jgi:tetratricopeptide (TPR) repeat protein
MIQFSRLTVILFFIITALSANAQSKKEKALAKGQAAVKLMDTGKVEQGIVLLKEAHKLDPGNYTYDYELARAYFLQKNYEASIAMLEKDASHVDADDKRYQLLGNNYYAMGNIEKANNVYDEGLAKFPASGPIYFEKGNICLNKKEYRKAFDFYEKGIEVDPEFTSNYYQATIILCQSKEEVWGMIYGEIFMNMERSTKRTFEISEWLYKTYKSQIILIGDSTYTVSFSQDKTQRVEDLQDPIANDLPYGFGVYEPTLMLSLIGVKSIDINSLHIIRSNFIDIYFRNGYNTAFPNKLFDYQKKVMDAGHFEAYNHWVLMNGDKERFDRWHAANTQKWDSFISWFAFNPFKVDASNRFYRGQYAK